MDAWQKYLYNYIYTNLSKKERNKMNCWFSISLLRIWRGKGLLFPSAHHLSECLWQRYTLKKRKLISTFYSQLFRPYISFDFRFSRNLLARLAVVSLCTNIPSQSWRRLWKRLKKRLKLIKLLLDLSKLILDLVNWAYYTHSFVH